MQHCEGRSLLPTLLDFDYLTSKTNGLRMTTEMPCIRDSVTHSCDDFKSPRVKTDILPILSKSAGEKDTGVLARHRVHNGTESNLIHMPSLLFLLLYIKCLVILTNN